MTTDLRQRLELAYRRHTGATSGHGAIQWIADLARVDRRTVSRALSGQIPPTRITAALDLLAEGRRAAREEQEEDHG